MVLFSSKKTIILLKSLADSQKSTTFVPDSPEKDSIIEEILIGMSEAKKRYNEIKDKQ
jgi:hypothetical protein